MEGKKHDIAVFAGYLKNNSKLKLSSSGGLAASLSEEILKNGGYVAGVVYSDDFHKAQYILTNNLEEVYKMRGSKYIEVDMGSIYTETQKKLDENANVLFFGLPCTIAALYKFLGKDYPNLITCELVCHGPTYAKVHKDYIDYLEKKFNSSIVDFSIKYKKQGWTPQYLYARFANGKKFIRKYYLTEYGYAFMVMGRKPCYSCKFKGDNRTGDMMIGDFWGATPKDDFWNELGVSVIFIHKERALDLLKGLSDVVLFDTTFERAVAKNPYVVTPKNPTNNRDAFEKDFLKDGLFVAANKNGFHKYYIMKNIEMYCPGLVSMYRKIRSKI